MSWRSSHSGACMKKETNDIQSLHYSREMEKHVLNLEIY